MQCARVGDASLPGESGTARLTQAGRLCLALVGAALMTACGATSHSTAGAIGDRAGGAARHAPLPAVCNPAAASAVARAAGVQPAAVTRQQGTSSEATPQCVYRAGALRVTALVDASPQPYFRLERTIVEATQQFGTVRLEPAPQQIGGLGLDASWFPKERQVMTTDGVRLITAAVGWSRVTQKRRRTLAEAVARAYLGSLDRKAAEPNGS